MYGSYTMLYIMSTHYYSVIGCLQSLLRLNAYCLDERHFSHCCATGSNLKLVQLVDIGVRRMLRPQAVFELMPEPDLFKCVTLMAFPLCND